MSFHVVIRYRMSSTLSPKQLHGDYLCDGKSGQNRLRVACHTIQCPLSCNLVVFQAPSVVVQGR